VGSVNGDLYAVNPNGTQKWAYTTGDIVESSPAIGSDGTIYFSTWSGNLYALNSSGGLEWESSGIDVAASTSPAIGSDGTLYVGGADVVLYAINPNGSQK